MKPTNIVWTVEQSASGINLVPTNHSSRSWRQLTIVRGLPGSGASTMGRTVQQCSDFEWIDIEEVLKQFSVSNSVSALHVRQAHDRARQLLGLAATRRSNIILTNPFTRWWEMDSYLSTLGIYSPDLMWKVKIIDLGAGLVRPRSDLMATKYLELAIRYQPIPAESQLAWLTEWVNHFNETRGRKPVDGAGNPNFARRYQYDSIQTSRVNLLMTWAELLDRMAEVCQYSHEDIQNLLVEENPEMLELAFSTLKSCNRPNLNLAKQKVVAIMDEAGLTGSLRDAVNSFWNIH